MIYLSHLDDNDKKIAHLFYLGNDKEFAWLITNFDIKEEGKLNADYFLMDSKEFCFGTIENDDIYKNVACIRKLNNKHHHILGNEVSTEEINCNMVKLDENLIVLAKNFSIETKQPLEHYFTDNNPNLLLGLYNKSNSFINSFENILSNQNKLYSFILKDLKKQGLIFLLSSVMCEYNTFLKGFSEFAKNNGLHNVCFSSENFREFYQLSQKTKFEYSDLIALAISICYELVELLFIEGEHEYKEDDEIINTLYDSCRNENKERFFHTCAIFFDYKKMEQSNYFEQLFKALERIQSSTQVNEELNILLPLKNLVSDLLSENENGTGSKTLLQLTDRLNIWKRKDYSSSVKLLVVCDYFPTNTVKIHTNRNCVRNIPPLSEDEIINILKNVVNESNVVIKTVAKKIFSDTGGSHFFMKLFFEVMDSVGLSNNLSGCYTESRNKLQLAINKGGNHNYKGDLGGIVNPPILSMINLVRNTLTDDNDSLLLPLPEKIMDTWKKGIFISEKWDDIYSKWLSSGLLNVTNSKGDRYNIFDDYAFVKISSMGKLSIDLSQCLKVNNNEF